MKRRIVFTVTNDLCFDQRMHRIVGALHNHGYDCLLVGRQRKSSLPLTSQTFAQRRLRCIFDRGFLFYAEYNIRLFLFLFRQRFDILCSIDLDTLIPGVLVSQWRRKTLVFDAHEFFTEMEEIVERPVVHRIWSLIARQTLPKVKRGYTISQGYRALYKKRYGIDLSVIRNIPVFKQDVRMHSAETTILYQGALNIGRGLEQSIEAMLRLPYYKLCVIGDGPLRSRLESTVHALNLKERVLFTGAMRPEVLRTYTLQATIGLTLFSETGLHHRHSLANRFFDYVHAGVPQIAMNFPEYRAFNEQFEVAVLIDELRPEHIAKAIDELLADRKLFTKLSENCTKAAALHNWQMEQQQLIQFYDSLP